MLKPAFRRVMQAIEALWGYKELNDYFRKLMINNEGGAAGFPKEAWEEIDMLHHIHSRGSSALEAVKRQCSPALATQIASML